MLWGFKSLRAFYVFRERRTENAGEKTYSGHGIRLNYYAVNNGLPPLVLLHAQGVDSLSLAFAHIAAEADWCERLILEDPPFFAAQGERRKQAFNYIDLSTVCHDFRARPEQSDFVRYYFEHQYAWNLFPEHAIK